MQAIFNAVFVQAAALSSGNLKAFVFALDVVRQNARIGIAAIEPHHETLKRLFKKYVPAEPRLTVLLDALQEATERLDEARPKSKINLQLVAQIWKDRESLMPQLEAWGVNGIIDPKDVERIRAGSGSMDAAQDVIAIASIVNRKPKLKSKMFGAELLDERVERAKAYLAIATPEGTSEVPNRALQEARDLQTRVWTLVAAQYDQLWLHGAAIYLRDVDEHVPLLGSRVVTKRGAPDAPPVPEPITG